MNTHLVWDNLVAYSMQIGLLVGLAAFVPVLLRLKVPNAKLAYWHILLSACLALASLLFFFPPLPTSPSRSLESCMGRNSHFAPGSVSEPLPVDLLFCQAHLAAARSASASMSSGG